MQSGWCSSSAGGILSINPHKKEPPLYLKPHHFTKAAVDHVSVRKQFGVHLAEFQSIQFRLAEMAMRLVASRLLVRKAAVMIDEKSPSVAIICAMAKGITP